MRRFDYSFLKSMMLPASILGYAEDISAIRALNDGRKARYGKIFTKLESVAKVQSVKGSNAIEGIVTTDKRIEEIVISGGVPLNHNEAEIAGYRDALAAVHGGYAHIDIRETDILSLHSVMLRYTNHTERGKYKRFDNVIAEITADGSRKARFVPVSAADTPAAMEQLILAYSDARGDAGVNPLLLIPCFVLDFLSIHPFSDGNGRMSRLLSLLLLYKNGFDAGKYISFEGEINKQKDEYYEALKQSSTGWHENKNDYLPFIQNFITALLFCYKKLDGRFTLLDGKKPSKKARIEAAVLSNLLPVSKSELALLLPDISETTVEAALAEMLKRGLIKKIGGNRNAKYVKA